MIILYLEVQVGYLAYSGIVSLLAIEHTLVATTTWVWEHSRTEPMEWNGTSNQQVGLNRSIMGSDKDKSSSTSTLSTTFHDSDSYELRPVVGSQVKFPKLTIPPFNGIISLGNFSWLPTTGVGWAELIRMSHGRGTLNSHQCSVFEMTHDSCS